MKTIIGLFLILFILLAGIAIFLNSKGNFKSPFAKTPTAIINKQIFSLKIAKTNQEKEIGLSGIKSFPENEGMLFPFGKEGFYSFWMKNMQFPIDIIFINKNRIVKIFDNVPAPKSDTESLPLYQPDQPADSVLEINAGLSKKYSFKQGDEVKLENL